MPLENKTKLRKAKEARVAEYLKTREFRMVPLEEIEISITLGIDSDVGLDELTEEILEHGLLSPVSIAGPYEDGKYRVIEGARRIKSLRSFLKGNKIPCYLVAGAVSDKEMQLLALGANRVHREDDASLNVKYAQIIFDECVDGLIEERYASKALAEITGMTPRQSRKYMKVTKEGTSKVLSAVAGSILPIDLATEIVKAAPDDDKQQDRMAEVLSSRPYGTKKALVNGVKRGEFSSHDTRALKAHADYLVSEEMQRRHSNEEARQIKRGEDSLSYLLSEKELPSPASMHRLAGLCKQVVDIYVYADQQILRA